MPSITKSTSIQNTLDKTFYLVPKILLNTILTYFFLTSISIVAFLRIIPPDHNLVIFFIVPILFLNLYLLKYVKLLTHRLIGLFLIIANLAYSIYSFISNLFRDALFANFDKYFDKTSNYIIMTIIFYIFLILFLVLICFLRFFKSEE